MNKKVTALTCVGLAAVLCVSFAACGGKNPKDIVSEEVSKEEWIAAFAEENFTNVKIEQKLIMEEKENGVEKIDSFLYVVILDGNKGYMKITTEKRGDGFEEEVRGEETVEYYCDKTDDIFKVYAKDKDGKWAVSNKEVNAFAITDAFLTYQKLYDDFEYNVEKKGYTVKSDSPQAKYWSEEYVFKFTNRKFVALWLEASEEKDEVFYYSLEGMVVTYGGQRVTLPTLG